MLTAIGASSTRVKASQASRLHKPSAVVSGTGRPSRGSDLGLNAHLDLAVIFILTISRTWYLIESAERSG